MAGSQRSQRSQSRYVHSLCEGSILSSSDTWSKETPIGHNVIEKIIPAVTFLANQITLRFDTLLSPSICAQHNMKDDTLLCHNLRESDSVFSSLRLK